MVGVFDYVRAFKLTGITSDSVDTFAKDVVSVSVAGIARETAYRLSYEPRYCLLYGSSSNKLI